ncbi:MAG: carbohydrate-binding protein [Salinivirgaceae bacterium]|jgi:uncharacterized repeat protein (TIGR02059 family)|nr:carbohydrate-binding protein [Salinivirgaceae bacterium]
MTKLLLTIQIVLLTITAAISQSSSFFLNDWNEKQIEKPDYNLVDKPTNDVTVFINIDMADTIQKISKYLFGNNAVSYCRDWSKEEGLVDDIAALGPNVIRWPGGNQAHEYFWNLAVGERPNDVPDELNIWSGITTENWRMSNDSYYELLKQTNSTGIICVNTGYARYGKSVDPVATAAHLAADWVRYDNGRSKFWEIGNEDYGNWVQGYKINTEQNQDGQPETVNGALYGKHAKVFIDSMRAAAAEIGVEIKIGVVAFEMEDSWDPVQTDWNEGMMPEVGNSADYYIVHSYFTPYDENSTVETIFSSSHTVPTEMMDALEDDTDEAGLPMLPVALTEWNIFAVGSMQQVSYINGMHSALTVGELIMKDYGLACKWDFANGWGDGNDHGMFSYGGEPGVEVFNPRPQFHYMYYFQKVFGDRMVKSTVSGNENIVAYASSYGQEDCGAVIINKSRDSEVVELEMENFYPGINYYYYTLTGGTDNGDFSRKVFINREGPSGEGGGADNYAAIKADASKIEGGIKINLPPLSVVYVIVEDVPPVLFSTAKVESDSKVISVQFTENMLVPENAAGFSIKANNTTNIEIESIVADTIDSTIIKLNLISAVKVDDAISISYNNGNITSKEGATLIPFTDELVNNLLPGSAPRLIAANTAMSGLSVSLMFNKFMQVTNTTLNDFELKIVADKDSIFDIESVSVDGTNGKIITIIPKEPLYIEYDVLVSYNGISTTSSDNGILQPFDTISVLNNSPGLPPIIDSTSVSDFGYAISVFLNKNMNSAEALTEDFTLKVNSFEIAISNITISGNRYNIIPISPIQYGDIVTLSYSGTDITSLDRGILEIFTDLSITNNLTEPTVTEIPGTVKCANFMANFGMELETCSDDDGGQSFGYIDPGDYADYLINVTEAGMYTIGFRSASNENGGQVILQTVADVVTNLDTVALPGTGGWQSWFTAFGMVQLESGQQRLRILALTSGYNLNWVSFEKGNTIAEVVLKSAATNSNGENITLVFDTELKTPSESSISNFVVKVDGLENTVTKILHNGGESIELVLAESISMNTSNITVSYTSGRLEGINNAPVQEFSDYQVENLVSISEKLNLVNVSVFPNPMSNQFSILCEAEAFESIKIIDLSGKLVFTKNIGNCSNQLINITIDLTKGTYVLTLENQKNIAKKLIVVD